MGPFVLATDIRFAGDKAILAHSEVGLGSVPPRPRRLRRTGAYRVVQDSAAPLRLALLDHGQHLLLTAPSALLSGVDARVSIKR